MRIIIVGGGLSGLSLSAMLRRVNIPSVVYEAAPNFEAVFQPPVVLWSNALSCMRAFGLDDVFATTQATDPTIPSDPFQFLHGVMKDQGEMQTAKSSDDSDWERFEDSHEEEIPPEDFFGIRDAKGTRWLLKQHNKLIQLPPMDELDNIPNSNAPFATSNSVVSRTIIEAHKTRLANVPLRVTLPTQTVKRTLMSHCPEIRFGRTITSITPSRGKLGGAIVHLDNGDTDWADIVVGADGLHSTVRRLIYTQEEQADAELKSHNMLQVDGFTRVDEFSSALGVNPCEFWGKRKVFSYYPNMTTNREKIVHAVSDDKKNGSSKKKQQQQHIVSFSATIFDAPKEIADIELDLVAQQPALKQLMAKEFSEFHTDIGGLFKDSALLRPAELLKVPMMPHWHHRRALLMGDAAHGAYPSYLQQDASLCVEDAAILATILATLPLQNDRGYEYGFRRFEQARRYRIQRYQHQSRTVRQFAAKSNTTVRDLILRCVPGHAANGILNWLSAWSYRGSEAEFDPEEDEETERKHFGQASPTK